MDDLQKVKKFLRQWESEFFQEHKRRPAKVGFVIALTIVLGVSDVYCFTWAAF